MPRAAPADFSPTRSARPRAAGTPGS